MVLNLINIQINYYSTSFSHPLLVFFSRQSPLQLIWDYVISVYISYITINISIYLYLILYVHTQYSMSYPYFHFCILYPYSVFNIRIPIDGKEKVLFFYKFIDDRGVLKSWRARWGCSHLFSG